MRDFCDDHLDNGGQNEFDSLFASSSSTHTFTFILTPVVPFTLHLQSIITMFPSTFLAISTLAGLAAAASHTVVVGGAAGLVFTPSNISAAIGDTVTFVFQAKNHSVTQSSFGAPCTPLMNASSGAMGFNSGYVPVAANATEDPAWTLQVQVATPIWAYCMQGQHCQNGMVFAINAVESGNKSFENYLTNAKAAPVVAASGTGTVVASGVGASGGALSSVAAAGAAPSSSGSSGGAYGGGYGGGAGSAVPGTTSDPTTSTTAGTIKSSSSSLRASIGGLFVASVVALTVL